MLDFFQHSFAAFFAPVAAWIEGYRDEIQQQVFFTNQPPRGRQ